VKQNLTYIVLGVVLVSLIPAISTYVKERREPKPKKQD
jgi:hypothetical protein